MDLIDDKYINLLSSRLQKFSKKGPNLYNCRCSICGDSQKNKNKARGYFYSAKNNTNYKCHNCGINISLNNFLKQIDPNLHQEYCLDKYSSGFTGKNFTAETPKFEFKKPTFKTKINLPKASENEESRKYLENRKLDSTKFYYVEKFKQWTNTIIKTFDQNALKYDEPRIIIPLYYNKNLVGYQGRAIQPNNIKYITVMFEDDTPKIYGLDEIEKDKTVYITEGPFDSTFINNAIALCGADGDVSKWGINDAVWIYDNEPRNTEILSRISRVIEMGQKVVIWPSTIKEKDINDMVLTGLNVQSVIESSTYFGLEAKLKFNEWKRV